MNFWHTCGLTLIERGGRSSVTMPPGPASRSIASNSLALSPSGVRECPVHGVPFTMPFVCAMLVSVITMRAPAAQHARRPMPTYTRA